MRVFPRTNAVALMPPMIVLSIAVLGGCATYGHGSTQIVEVASQPAGATVTVAGTTIRKTTPASIEIDRRTNPVVLRFEMAGHESVERPLRRSIHPMVWANVLFGSILGVAADRVAGGSLPGRAQGPIGGAALGFAGDFFLGGAYEYSPTAVSVTLPPVSSDPPETAP